MLSVKNLFFEYPGKRALNDVSFELKEQTITALVGPNGAGKTTLLRCIAGLDRPFSGQITLDGIDVLKDPKKAHMQIGYLSDFFGVYADLSVERCLYYAGRIRGIPENEINARVKLIATQLGIENYLGKQAETLSRGMRQRLGIAQAIIHSPKLLILDEPASGLDPEARMSLSGLMTKLRNDGMTLVVSSHILSELEDYSTEMVVIRDARVVGVQSLDQKEAKKIRLITLKFASAVDEKIDNVISDYKTNERSDNHLVIEFPGDDSEQAELLAKIIKAGVPLTEFFVHSKSMQDFYMDIAENKEPK